MQEQVGIDGFLQGGLEGVDEAVGQVANESHRIGQGYGAAQFGQVQLAGGRVQGGEQLVGRIGPCLHERVEERGLARVGVSDQGDVEGIPAGTLAPLGGALALDLLQALAGALDRVVDHAAVELDLGFAGAAARADAAALALQVGPAAHEAGAEVLQPGEFDLELALVAPRALREDLEDEQGAVGDRQFEMSLEVALLGRAEGLVEQHFHRAVHLREHADFIGLAAADEQRGIGRLALAGQPGHGSEARGLRQQAQLFQLGVEMGKAEIHPHQDDGSGLRFRG